MAINFTAADRVGSIGGYIGGAAALLHQDVARRIEKYKRDTGHQPSEAMQAIYDYTHRRSIAAAEKVADLQKMYR